MMPGTERIKIDKILEDKVILEVSKELPFKCEFLETKENERKNIILNVEKMIYGRTPILPIEAGYCYKAKVLYIRKVKSIYIY